MSEYISIEVEYGDDPNTVYLHTNLNYGADGEAVEEDYPNPASGQTGTPIAQFLFEIAGLEALKITGSTLVVQRAPDTEWHTLIDELTTALKQFFL
jgi:Scaffold protein Nfu/NifU N terminal